MGLAERCAVVKPSQRWRLALSLISLVLVDQRPTLSSLHKGAAIGKQKGKVTSENGGSETACFGWTVCAASKQHYQIRQPACISKGVCVLRARVLPLTLRTYIRSRVRTGSPRQTSAGITQLEGSSIISSTPKTKTYRQHDYQERCENATFYRY